MSVFTAAQWQELEHQALFFKFMVSGRPIPPDLIFSIKERTSLPHHTGWTCFQLGPGQGNTDPEPNRCRRTDGKKWRCSRQTTGDLKYCERHMHRGKSRSRKLPPDTKPLQTSPYKSSSSSSIPKMEAQTRIQQSAPACGGTRSNSSNLSTVTCHKTHHQSFDLFNSYSSKPVKDSTFMAFQGIETPDKSFNMKGERIMYHQFIEESPPQTQGKRDSWLNLNLVI